MKIREIVKVLETFAPPALMESYDNSGLIIGDPSDEVSRALISLDLTDAVVDEAIEKACQLIINHHPLIFKGLKSIGKARSRDILIRKLIRNDIAVYALHTNLDNIINGVNQEIAERLKLNDLRVLRPLHGQLIKLVVFCPETHADEVRQAIFDAGAGHIGDYDRCSFNIQGTGTFRGGDASKPFVGRVHQLHQENEIRIEVIMEKTKTAHVLKALLEKHPYEEVAYDLYPIENLHPALGAGIIGSFTQAIETHDFLDLLKKTFGTPVLRHSKLRERPIKTVAACGGSGAFLINDAKKENADAYISGDIKYHDFFDADHELFVVDIGHYESEQFTKEKIQKIIREKLPNFATQISDHNTNAVNYF